MPKYKFSEIAYNINQKKMPEPGDEEMYIGLEHLDSGSLKVKRWGSDVPITGEKLVMKKGDILFGRRNTYLRRAAIAPHDGIFSAHGMIFRPNTAVMDEDYFPFFISSDYFMNAAIRISVGSLSPTVNWKTLKELEFDIPDLESQRKSAELLTAANRLKEAYEILLEETDQLVKSQFIEMFGTIDSEGTFPRKEWSEVLKIINGKDYRKIEVDTGGYPVYGSGGYMARASEYLCPENTVIVGRKGTINNPLLIKEKFWNVDTAFGLVAGCEINPVYLYWYCLQFDFTTLNKATTLPSTTKSDLLKLKINVPPIDKQNEFMKFVEQSDKSKFEIKQSIKNITEVINSLLQQDFNI